MIAARCGHDVLWNQYMGHPDKDLPLDFKIQKRADTFIVNGKCYKPDAFGNFVAGFAGESAGGRFGLWGAEIGGIWFDITDQSRKSNLNPLSWDADSRPDINAGFRFSRVVNQAVNNLSHQGYSGFQYSINTVSITLSQQQILKSLRP